MKDSAEIILEDVDVEGRFSLVMYDDSFHPGVVGIISSRMKDKYGRPTIVFAPGDNGKIKGSGRSIPGLHLRDALDIVSKRHPGILPAFGGHAMACGCVCDADRFGEFVEAFEKVVRELICEDDLLQYIESDGSLLNEQISIETADKINAQVWGQGFPAPQFDDEFEILDQKILKEKHLKLKLLKDDLEIDGIFFFHNTLLPTESRLVYSLSVNEFRGNKTVQLMIRHAENIGVEVLGC